MVQQQPCSGVSHCLVCWSPPLGVCGVLLSLHPSAHEGHGCISALAQVGQTCGLCGFPPGLHPVVQH